MKTRPFLTVLAAALFCAAALTLTTASASAQTAKPAKPVNPYPPRIEALNLKARALDEKIKALPAPQSRGSAASQDRQITAWRNEIASLKSQVADLRVQEADWKARQAALAAAAAAKTQPR